jgi:hypothetical protein
MEKLEKSLVGACGVFHVSAELSRRGWIAMPTIRNTKGIDLIATKDNRDVRIQVKTNSYGKVKYILGKSNETLMDNDLYYAFVTLKIGKLDRPDFYIVPSSLVAKYIKKTHKKFAVMPPKRKTKRPDTAEARRSRRTKSTMRQFPNHVGKKIPEFCDFNINDYKEGWGLLEKNNK